MLFQRVQISYICPQSFPSVPNIQFSDNISAPDIVNRHTSRLKGFIYEKFKLHVHYAQFTPYTFSIAVSRHFSNLPVQMPMCLTIFEQGVSKRRKLSRTTFSFQMAWQIILRKYVWWEKNFWLAVVLARFKVCNVFFDKCNSREEIGSVITVNLTVQRKGYNEKPILK